jgi:hypothetical protein
MWDALLGVLAIIVLLIAAPLEGGALQLIVITIGVILGIAAIYV